MKRAINRPIQIEFGDAQNFISIPWGDCQPENSLAYRAVNLARLEYTSAADFTDNRLPYSKIILNPDFEQTLVHGANQPRESCRHGNDLDLLRAAIFHELAVAYDLALNSDTEFQVQLKEGCHNFEPGWSRALECRALKQIKRRVSDHSPFLSMMGYRKEASGHKSRQFDNALSLRTVYRGDPELLSSPAELFASVVEDYLMDAGMYCAYPGIWNFLTVHFETGWLPPACARKHESDVTDFPNLKVDHDATRVYRVDYLYVYPGTRELNEMFGHSMLRVVACDPSRPEPGPECESDTAYHYVVTFYESHNLGVLQKLLGKGITQTYIYDFSSVVSYYTDKEQRAIDVIPLKMRREQIATLLGLTWEWNHRNGDTWSDFSNNCVTHTMDLLRAAVPELEFVNDPLLRPSNLADFLQQSVVGQSARLTIAPIEKKLSEAAVMVH